MRRAARPILVLVSVSLVTTLLTGCGGVSVEFQASDASYTSTQARLVLDRIETSRYADRPASDGAALRSSALADLRSQGDQEARAADLITKTFPPGTRSVPVYVERAIVDGRKSLVIVEAWGSPDGNLDRKRLWAIEEATGDVVYSAASK